jgi:FkbM family methyltransferase
MKYYGQYKQDEVLDKLLRRKQNGFFLDVGAHDGIAFSNSLFFEKFRNFRGICFEPNPDVFANLINNRKVDCINAAVAEQDGRTTFTKITGYAEMLSGLENYRDDRHKLRASEEIKKYGGDEVIIEVDTININSLINKRIIDFLCLDIEGGEFEVLKTISFQNVKCKIILVEVNYKDQEENINILLKKNQFFKYTRIGSDFIYLNRHSFPFKFLIYALKVNYNRYLHNYRRERV